MNKRSVTLLETLIALVLVVAMAVLVLPSLMQNFDERSFESAADVTNEQLMLARAHAQATGSAVEVTYNAGTSQVQARLFHPWLAPMQTAQDQTAESKTNGGAAPGPWRDREESEPSSIIGESWACRVLGRGMRLLSHPPTPSGRYPLAPIDPLADADDSSETFDELINGQEIRLAVFMPDGSALTGDPIWLNDDNGRRGMFVINQWSGLTVFQRLADLEAASSNSTADELHDNAYGDDEEINPSAPLRSSAGTRNPVPSTRDQGD